MFLFFLLCFQFQSTNAGNESLSKQKHKARLVICDFLTMLSSCDKKDKIFFRDQPVGNLSFTEEVPIPATLLKEIQFCYRSAQNVFQ